MNTVFELDFSNWVCRWTEGLKCYIFFIGILVISGRWKGDNENCVELCLRLEMFPLIAGIESGNAWSAGQRLTD